MVFENLLGFELPPLLLVAVVLFVVVVVSSRSGPHMKLPPCPAYAYPLVGHLPYLAKDPRGKIMEWSKKQGEIFSIYFGSTLVVVFSSYDVLKETLIKQADLFSDKPKDGMLPIMKITEGIISNSGASWKENRSTVLTILKDFGMGKNVMAEKVTEEINAYLEEVAKFNGEPGDPKDITIRAVSNIICNFLLGQRFEYSNAYYKELLDLYEHLINITQAGTLQIWFPWVKYLPGDLFHVKRCKVLDDQFIDFANQFIKAAEDENNSETNKHNIIASYMAEFRRKQEKGQPTLLNKEGMRRIIADLLTAGSETVATTVLYFYIYMIHNPHIQDKVIAEIDEKIGPNRAPTIADKASLTYVNAAIMETQRIASIVPLGLFHRCTEETTIRGYTIPKDTYVMPHSDAVLLSETIWGDPLTFRPERFIDSKGNLLNPECFMPFSIGRRACVGEALAKAELFLFIAHIFHRYRVEPASPDSVPSRQDFILGITSCPVPYKLKFVNRRA